MGSFLPKLPSFAFVNSITGEASVGLSNQELI